MLKARNILLEEEESVPVLAKQSEEEKEDRKLNILSPELKVRHKQSKYRYTIDSIDEPTFVLRDPMGKKFSLDRGELEKDYVLD